MKTASVTRCAFSQRLNFKIIFAYYTFRHEVLLVQCKLIMLITIIIESLLWADHTFSKRLHTFLLHSKSVCGGLGYSDPTLILETNGDWKYFCKLLF